MQAPGNPQPPLALVSGPVKLGASCAGGSAIGITFDGRASPPSANRQLASCACIDFLGHPWCDQTAHDDQAPSLHHMAVMSERPCVLSMVTYLSSSWCQMPSG